MSPGVEARVGAGSTVKLMSQRSSGSTVDSWTFYLLLISAGLGLHI